MSYLFWNENIFLFSPLPSPRRTKKNRKEKKNNTMLTDMSRIGGDVILTDERGFIRLELNFHKRVLLESLSRGSPCRRRSRLFRTLSLVKTRTVAAGGFKVDFSDFQHICCDGFFHSYEAGFHCQPLPSWKPSQIRSVRSHTHAVF